MRYYAVSGKGPVQSDTVRYEQPAKNAYVIHMCMYVIVKYSRNTVRYIQICTSKYSQIQSDTVRYSQIQSDMNCSPKCICACIKDKNTDTYMHTCIALKQCISACMFLCVYGIQANMHLIQRLCENRYMQIQAYTCRYMDACITYRQCICDIHCVISVAYVCMHM